ncbi:MAG: acetamidase/formamidase family protein [Chloroflexi bacterium]|nr:acetamidase/formamidase family protein [Chloroflexota bacterium]
MTGVQRIPRTSVGFFYDAAVAPILQTPPGSTVVFETQDARGGRMFSNPVGELVDLPRPPVGRGNPVTGPVAIQGARPGDTLVVSVLDIKTSSPGWCGGHAHVHPLAPGRIPRSRGRVCEVVEGKVYFSSDIQVPERPMIGCMGVARPGQAIPCGQPGRHGGNMDHNVVGPGSRVYLPVSVPDALLWIGDVHATQGDGELSGVGLEIAADVTVRIELQSGRGLEWPWIETADRLMSTSADVDFATARRQVVESMLRALEHQLQLEPAEGLALISAVGDLRVGQAYGGMELTLRLEMPRSLGLVPE